MNDLAGVRVNNPMHRKVWPTDYEQPGETHGVRCPKCNCPRSKVTHTRHSMGGRNMRRRTCGNCGHNYPTFEKTI